MPDSDSPPVTGSAPDRAALLRRVAWNQGLWTAGYALTTGGLLSYFAKGLGASSFLIGVILALPETAGVLGLGTRRAARWAGGKKRAFVVGTLLARAAGLPIPMLAVAGLWPAGTDRLAWLVGCVAVTHAIGSVAFVAYVSWLSDLTPERHWGRLFARREVFKAAVLIGLPAAVGYLRDSWRGFESLELVGYSVTFLVGQALMAASLVPMLALPDCTPAARELPRTDWGLVRRALADRPTRLILLHGWTLSFANGLTQSAFFLYSASWGPLGVGVGTYYLLAGLMWGLQIPAALWAGGRCDRRGSLTPRVAGVLVGSSGLIFWLVAVRETWWLLFGAYALWGAYSAANVAGDKLLLTHAPRGDNATHFALFAKVGGLLTGVAGLLGAAWLDHLLATKFAWQPFGGGYTVAGYQVVFAASLLGRYASVGWLWPLRRAS